MLKNLSSFKIQKNMESEAKYVCYGCQQRYTGNLEEIFEEAKVNKCEICGFERCHACLKNCLRCGSVKCPDCVCEHNTEQIFYKSSLEYPQTISCHVCGYTIKNITVKEAFDENGDYELCQICRQPACIRCMNECYTQKIRYCSKCEHHCSRS